MPYAKIKQSSSIITSPLFRRFLAPIILTMLGFALAVYFFAVPFLRTLVYSLEEKSVQTNLNDIHSLIASNYSGTEAYKKSVIAAHKREMKNITLFTETYLKNKYAQVQEGLISEDQAQMSALEELKKFKYGKDNENFVWVADYNGYYLSHPNPKMNMADFSEVRDVFGNYVLTPLIQKSIEKGEGYHSYWWQRPGSDLPAEKLSYARVFPQWEWVIGTGVYIDDLQAEILVRKEKMIEGLRQILGAITIGKTGYLYIFDSWNNVIIHPNKKLENSDMSKLINPSTKHKLVDDLIAASHSSSHKFSYKWNKPSDKSHYIYDRIDWVKHVKGFDWYIVASVYKDELNASSNLLRDKIIIIAGVVVFMSIFIVALLMGRLLMPVRKLSIVAGQVEDGDLLARCEVHGNDELGILGRAFNRMVDRLRTNIEELDHKVMLRTKELNGANDELTLMVGQLEQHNEEITYLNLLSEQLQMCDSIEDVYPVVADFMTMLFPHAAGMLAMADSGGYELMPVLSWGGYQAEQEKMAVGDCLAIKKDEIFVCERPGDGEICKHIGRPSEQHLSLCLPLKGKNKLLGMIYLQCHDDELVECASSAGAKRTEKIAHMRSLSASVIDHVAMALANIKLMIRLQHLSVRDGLTGLFNRRYMEETMAREFQQAERKVEPVGVIMLDVDFFKKFNDTYGHDAGDLVLIELAKVLKANVRKEDVVCRYGGEEFVIILPGPPEQMAIDRAEMIRKHVDEKLRIKYNEHNFHVNISLGAAFYPKHGKDPEVVLKAADDALYQAKEHGRNRAMAAS